MEIKIGGLYLLNNGSVYRCMRPGNQWGLIMEPLDGWQLGSIAVHNDGRYYPWRDAESPDHPLSVKKEIRP